MKKSVIAILMTAIISLSLIVPLLSTSVQAFGGDTDNMTVDGVLKSDSYVLYPYTKQNLYLGISKYGELINGVAKQGLKYGTMDVFANSAVAESDWSQGWYIDIHFADNDNRYQNIWAFAMYSDLSGSGGIGGDWKENCSLGPLGAPHGGRKTNAWASTAPITVLYDGPREFIAQTNTTIYLAATKTADDALVSVVLTFVFNKDKKCVTVLKDIKRLNPGKWTRTFQVEFSNRGEWDIGTTPAPPSYANFYHNLPTVYDYTYHDYYSAANPITGFDMAQMINKAGTYVGFAAFWPQLMGKIVDGTTHLTRTQVLSSLCTQMHNETWKDMTVIGEGYAIRFVDQGWLSADSYPRGAGEWSDEPMVFKNGVLQSGAGADYTWDSQNDIITFVLKPSDTDIITVVYKHSVNPGEDNMANHTAEPDTPYVIGEWCFDLKSADKCRQFRAVTVYGLTDRHDGDDYNTVAADRFNFATFTGWSFGYNAIDKEVQYYLDEVFNPWDLTTATNKQELRWVYKTTLTTDTTSITLTSGLTKSSTLYTTPTATTTVICNATAAWAYSTSGMAHSKYWMAQLATTVVDGVSAACLSSTWGGPLGYLSADSPSCIGFYAMLTSTPPAGLDTQVYMMIRHYVGSSLDYALVSSGTTISGITSPYTWTYVTPTGPTTTPSSHNTENTGFSWTLISADSLSRHGVAGDGSETHSYAYYVQNGFAADAVRDVVVVNQAINAATTVYVDDVVAWNPRSLEDGKLVPSKWDAYLDFDAEYSFAERVLVNGTLWQRYGFQSMYAFNYYTIDFASGKITFYTFDMTTFSYIPVNLKGSTIKVLYSTMDSDEIGRYEWGVVGRDAATVDSAGLSLIPISLKIPILGGAGAAQIDYGIAGEDMNDPLAANAMPSVMSKIGTGTTMDDYKDSLGRAHLADDWCSKWPVASSDMIGEGGPIANLLAYYGNDFTTALYGLSPYAGTAYSGKITGVACWNRGWNGTWNVYGSSNTVGYAVISTYKDINGTVLFLVWGHWGRDTYYASQWIHGDAARGLSPGVTTLQSLPRGVTSIILRISYPSSDPTHPTFSIPEYLGTISETVYHHDP
jgi:hypothetical protein